VLCQVPRLLVLLIKKSPIWDHMMAALLLRLCALSGVVALTATAQAADNVEPSTVKKVHLIQANHLECG
jgi:hypothetical protein